MPSSPQWLNTWLKANPWMAASIVLQLALAGTAVVGLVIDKRQILGLNVWVKPFKFDVSVLIMLVTVAIFLSGLERFSTLRRWAGEGFAVSLAVENCMISLQAWRGVRSHMNYTTPFDARVFALMGVMVGIAAIAVVVMLGLYLAERPRWPGAVTWGIRLGLMMLLAGCIEGGLMVAHGGHTVGAVDGLPGMRFTNWSRNYGDLRIAHFFALHAVQAFPTLGYLCSRTALTERLQVAAVFAGATMYTVAVWLLFRQAMHGTPFLG